MFLDLAYCIREWTNDNCKICGILVFPEMATARGDRYLANAYAALLELNYYSCSGYAKYQSDNKKIPSFILPGVDQPITKNPFDWAYILGTANDQGVQLSISALPRMIAERIYLNFESSCERAVESLLNNGKDQRGSYLIDPKGTAIHARNFSTFGLSSIRYPVGELMEMFSYRLCLDLLTSLLEGHDIPGDVNARVGKYLPDLMLTDDYLLGNRDHFRVMDYESVESEMERQINAVLRDLPERNIATYLTQKQEELDSQFRSVGIMDFYKGKRGNLEGCLIEVNRLLEKKVSEILIDPLIEPSQGRGVHLGLKFAEKMLEELRKILEEKHQLYVNSFNGIPNRLKNSESTLRTQLNEVQNAEKKLLFRGQAMKDALQKWSAALKIYLSAKANKLAYEFGITFLSQFGNDISALIQRLRTWSQNIEELQKIVDQHFNGQRTFLQEISYNTQRFNGAILFDSGQFEKLFQSLDRAGALRSICEELRQDLLGLPFQADALDRVYRSSLRWLQEGGSSSVAAPNICDKLMEDRGAMREKLSINFNKSKPFLRFTDAEIRKGFDQPYSLEGATTSGRVCGLIKNDQLPNVRAVRSEIADVTGLQDVEACMPSISDPHEIIFLQEYTAFPLRCILDLADLRKYYDQYVRSPSAPPLHICREYDPPLYSPFLITTQELKSADECEENFLLLWVEKRIMQELNRKDGRTEIRYRYQDQGMEKFQVLGNGWVDSLEYVKSGSDPALELRSRMVSEVKLLMKQYETCTRRNELWQRILKHLAELKAGLELGEEDVVFLARQAIASRLCNRFNLYDATAQSTALPSHPEPSLPLVQESLPSSEEKFMNLARTILKQSRGQLTPAFENLLRSTTAKENISWNRAEQLIQEVHQEFSRPNEIKEYEQLFRAFLFDGIITDEERALLIQRQYELGLTDEQVSQIEASVQKTQKTSQAQA